MCERVLSMCERVLLNVRASVVNVRASVVNVRASERAGERVSRKASGVGARAIITQRRAEFMQC